MSSSEINPVEVARDKRKRISKIEKELEKARATGAPQSKIRELQNQVQDILLEGRAMSSVDGFKDKARKLVVLEMRRDELKAELKQVEKQIKDLLNQG